MGDMLISGVEWGKKKGKWACSLICYNTVFNQIWLESGGPLSFKVQSGRYCVGYTTLSSRASRIQAALEPWKAMEPCPSTAKINKGYRCSFCDRADLVHACLICDGTECLAEHSIQMSCHKATAYVYIASFGLNLVKVGVAHNTRIPQRWIEQGANLAKKIIVGNGMEVRRFENTIHQALDVLPGLRTSKKVDTLWQKQSTEAQVYALTKVEDEIRKRFPEFPFCQEPLHDISSIYDLPPLDRRPIEIKVKKNLQISGRVLGAKGYLLLLSMGNLPHFLNLNYLIGRKIERNEANTIVTQTALDKF